MGRRREQVAHRKRNADDLKYEKMFNLAQQI